MISSEDNDTNVNGNGNADNQQVTIKEEGVDENTDHSVHDQANEHHNKENKHDNEDDIDDDDDDEDDDNIGEDEATKLLQRNDIASPTASIKKKLNGRSENAALMRFADSIIVEEAEETDPEILKQIALIEKAIPTTELEIALSNAMKRKTTHLNRLTAEILKLKNFISKRKQTYKRKRKDDGAPTRALSAYNIFIQERFALLAKENEKALKSENEDATLKRVPPAHLVAATGNVWKTLSLEEKMQYEERAKGDRKRYDEQMAEYQPPDKQINRKRNKTGYNMFFSSHVLRLKQTDSGVPSERGSVARLVGSAWKLLSPEERAYYESEADKHNGMNPVKDVDEDDDDEVDDNVKQRQQHHMEYPMPPPHSAYAEMHMHGGLPPPPMHPALTAQQHLPPPHHHTHPYYPPPPQHHPPPHMYAHAPPPPQHAHPPYGHYDYSQHHQRHQARATQQGGASGGYQPQGYQPGASSRRGTYDG